MKIEKVVRNILSDVLDLPKRKVKKISLEEDLRKFEFDSLKAIELIVKLEETFGITIEDEDLLVENLASIQDILKVLNKYLEQE